MRELLRLNAADVTTEGTTATPETETETGKPKAKPSICPYCNKKGHKTINSKNCDYSTVQDSPHYREDNEERATGKLCTVVHLYCMFCLSTIRCAPDTWY
jgi:hypothetical protein